MESVPWQQLKPEDDTRLQVVLEHKWKSGDTSSVYMSREDRRNLCSSIQLCSVALPVMCCAIMVVLVVSMITSMFQQSPSSAS